MRKKSTAKQKPEKTLPPGRVRQLAMQNHITGISTAYAAIDNAIQELEVAEGLYKRNADKAICVVRASALRGIQLLLEAVLNGKQPG